MAENKDYVSTELENGSVNINEDVITTVAAADCISVSAVRTVGSDRRAAAIAAIIACTACIASVKGGIQDLVALDLYPLYCFGTGPLLDLDRTSRQIGIGISASGLGIAARKYAALHVDARLDVRRDRAASCR